MRPRQSHGTSAGSLLSVSPSDGGASSQSGGGGNAAGLTQEARRQAADAARAGRAERNSRLTAMIVLHSLRYVLPPPTVWRHRCRLRKTTARLFEPAA